MFLNLHVSLLFQYVLLQKICFKLFSIWPVRLLISLQFCVSPKVFLLKAVGLKRPQRGIEGF